MVSEYGECFCGDGGNITCLQGEPNTENANGGKSAHKQGLRWECTEFCGFLYTIRIEIRRGNRNCDKREGNK